MYALLFALAAVVALWVVGRPLMQEDPGFDALAPLPRAASAALEREKALAALAEVENDYQTGKLAAADYEELKARYARKLMALLPAPLSGADQGGRPAGAPTAIQVEAEAEAELLLASLAAEAAAARGGGNRGAASPRATGSPAAGSPASGAPAAAAQFCHQCGASLPHAGQRFCQACGAAQ